MTDFHTEVLNPRHKKTEFDCGIEVFNSYLRNQAGQDLKKRLAVCFVWPDDSGKVSGYYTLSNYSINRELIPESLRKKFPPSYINIPVTLLGRLAIDKNQQKSGLGGQLLMDALMRSYKVSSEIGSIAVVVDLYKNELKNFYARFGFIEIPGTGKMFMAMKTIAAAI